MREASKSAVRVPPVDPLPLEGLIELIERRYGVDLRQYRQRFLGRRIRSRMMARGVADCTAYSRLLRDDPGEYDALLEALSINVSRFMRDRTAFSVLRDQALSPLLQERRSSSARRLALWSAGCATGEEPYSVALLLAESLQSRLSRWRLTVHGTDVSAKALAWARRGCYRPESFGDLDAPYVQRYFSSTVGGLTLERRIRDLVTWYRQDLRTTPPLPAYDLILCRNVLIYYDRAEQEAIVSHLIDHLVPGGYLMLGMVEMLPPSQTGRLVVVNARHRLYCRSPLS